MIDKEKNKQRVPKSFSSINKPIYELSEDDALALYEADKRIVFLIDLGVLRFIDKHLVVNRRKFITPKTKHLTALAKRNLSSCCIGILWTDSQENKVGKKRIKCTLDLFLSASEFLENERVNNDAQSDIEIQGEAAKINKEIERVSKIINDLPGSFSGSLKYLMNLKGYTEELLAEESLISVSTIKQYRQKEEKEKTLKTVVALCIGMHLHPWLTENLLRKAGVFPKATKQDGAFKYLYTYHFKDSVRECNKYLRSQGLAEFSLREKMA